MAAPPRHILSLRQSVGEVRRLVEIHTHLTGTGPGRRYDVQVLNKSAILLTVATWESCIEALVKGAAAFMAAELTTPKEVPPRLAAVIASRLKNEKHDGAVWGLADAGWREHIELEASERIKRLNTPSAQNIDDLIYNTIGLSGLSSRWHWIGCNNKAAIEKLNRLIDTRHEIAHGVAASRSVTKQYVERSTDFVIRLAAISSNRVGEYLQSLTKKRPWDIYVKGNAR